MIPQRLIVQCLLLGIRLANAAAKFALAVYMARYLGLGDVGVFGLLVGATTGIQAVFGFGLSDWMTRKVVGLDRAQAIPLAMARLALSVGVEILIQAVIWSLLAVLGFLPAPTTVLLIAGILLLEHIAYDLYAIEIGRERTGPANLQFFLRSGAWPPVVILVGLLIPSARTLDMVLLGWLGGLLLMLASALVTSLRGGRWRHLGFNWRGLDEGFRVGIPFWIAETGQIGNLYLDRFLVSAFLGLELTGVYTFFWSYANVVHTLAVNGIVQPQVPKLVAADASGDRGRFEAERRRIMAESRVWGLLLAGSVGIALPFLLPWVDRPMLAQNLWIFAIVLVATLARMAADTAGFLLYSLHRDREIATTSIAGVLIAAALNLALIPQFGILGASVAYLLVGVAVTMLRLRLAQSPRGRIAGASAAE